MEWKFSELRNLIEDSSFNYRPQMKLGKVMFYKCLSVHRMGTSIPPGPDTPSGTRHPNQERTWEQTESDIISPVTTKAGGTHPTGMFSCFQGSARLCINWLKETRFGRRLATTVNTTTPGTVLWLDIWFIWTKGLFTPVIY